METLTETEFFKAVSGTNKSHNLKALYRDFIYKTVELYNNTDMDFHELVFTLHHTHIELTTLHEPPPRASPQDMTQLHYLHKAMLFTQAAINYLGSSAPVASRLSVEVKNSLALYNDIRHRKGESRTYFLDCLAQRLNQRMDCEDERE